MLENKVTHDKDKDKITPIAKRFIVLEFHKPGKYYLNLIKVRSRSIPDLYKVDNEEISYSDKSIVEDRLLIPITIESVLGKITPQ